MTLSAASHEAQLLQASLHKASARVSFGVALFYFSAIGISAMLWPVISHKRILVWLSFFVLAYANMVWFQIRYNKVEGTPNLDLNQWLFQRNIGLSLMGTSWGLLSIFLWPSNQHLYQLALPMTTLAACASMVISYPSYRTGYIIFSTLAFVPTLVRLMYEGTWPQYWVVFVGTIILGGWLWLGENLREWITRVIIIGIENRELAEKLNLRNEELQASIKKVTVLSGMLPICANCKKIRDDQGYYQQIEHYITEHSEAEFTHGICPDCAKELYPEINSPDI